MRVGCAARSCWRAHTTNKTRGHQRANTQTTTHKHKRQEGDAFDVVPGSAFTVARTANRSNTSDYYVSGRKSSAKDVAALLKGKGIDLDNNRFLILQGEVEQISLMKPKAEDKVGFCLFGGVWGAWCVLVWRVLGQRCVLSVLCALHNTQTHTRTHNSHT